MEVSKEILEELYINQKKTIDEVSEILNIPKTTLRSRLFKYGIKKTRHKTDNINKDELYNLYCLENKTIEELMEIYSCTRNYITSRLRKYELRKLPKISNENEKIIIDLYLSGVSVRKISDKYKLTERCISKCLSDNNIPILLGSGENRLPKYIIGLEFDGLTVIEKVGRCKYKCRCFCGNIVIRDSRIIKRNAKKSCGCLLKGKANNNWSGYGDISGSIWGRIKKGAEKRNIKFDLDIKEAWELYLKQNKKCAITNLDIVMPHVDIFNIKRKNHKILSNMASLDRIDSSKDYTIDNVQWVLTEVNLMKMGLNQELFLEICKLVKERIHD